MADRTVAVRLRAITDQYKRDMVGAANATKKFGSDSVAATKSVSTELSGVKTASTIVGGALLGLAGTAVIAAAAFDKQMSGVAAVTGATAGEMEKLRDAALKAGQATVYSASEAATAEAELAKAGIKTSDILGGALVGSLDLAAAGQLALGDAATIAAQAMNTFGLKGKDVSHIADVLAAGANKSAADVGQLGDALRQGGLVAKQTGLSLEDTVGVLSAFADRALIGSDAGTSLKSMLQRLTPQSKQASDAMKNLGLKAYDAQGNFVGLAAFAGNLKTSLSKLTPEARAAALGVIFGSDAVRGATVLYDLGAEGVRNYTDAVNDSGAASRMAATQLDNLAGDWEQLSGSLETAFIKSGSQANGVLRETVQVGTQVVNFIGSLPGPTLAAGVGIATLSGAFLIAAPRIAEFNAQLAASPGLAKAAGLALKTLGAATAVTAIATIALDIMNANNATEDFNKSLNALYGDLSKHITSTAIDDLNSKIQEMQERLADPGWIKKAEGGIQSLIASINGDDFTKVYQDFVYPDADRINKATEAMGTLNSAIGNAAGILGVDYARALELADQSGVALTGTSADITDGIVAYAKATADGSVASHKAADSMDVLSDATASVDDQLKALKDQWDATTGALLGASDATIAAERALDDMSKSVKDNGNTWDITTEKGRANQSQLNDSIQTFEDLRTKLIETGQATEQQANAKMVGYLTQLRDNLPKSAKTARAELDALITKYKEIPASKTTSVKADTSQAVAAVNALGHLIDATLGGVRFSITASGDVNAHGTKRKARGGFISGPGSWTSDSISAQLSNGEFVVNAAATARHRGLLESINGSAGAAVTSASPRLSSGGDGGTFTVTAPVQLLLDSVAIWQGQLRLKRSRGGIDLGLA